MLLQTQGDHMNYFTFQDMPNPTQGQINMKCCIYKDIFTFDDTLAVYLLSNVLYLLLQQFVSLAEGFVFLQQGLSDASC